MAWHKFTGDSFNKTLQTPIRTINRFLAMHELTKDMKNRKKQDSK